MAANVESMFSVREKPWHGLGTVVAEALTSSEALTAAGLDWNVMQEPIYTDTGNIIPGYRANVRDSDRRVLGVVTDRYKVIQNQEAFAFTDSLLGSGVRYETAGSLQEGKKVWLLARLPREYIISGEHISPYLVFSNTHDGSGAVKVALTLVRVVCNNTLNLALGTAPRSWSMMHTGNISDKIQEAKDTLFMAEQDANREFFGNSYHDSDYIFTWENGTPYDPDYISKLFCKATEAYGRPEITLHKLRHTCASLLINKGWDVKKLQYWLGHSDTSTTLNIYSHFNRERLNEIPADLEELSESCASLFQ